MDLKVFHDNIRRLLNKEQGGWLPDPEIDDNIDIAQLWLFNQMLPFYGKSEKAVDPLSPFSVKQDFITGVDGLITLPTDQTVNPCYLALPTISISYYDSSAQRTRYKAVKILPDDQVAERRDSSTLEPTVTDPVAQELTPGLLQLYPLAAMSGYVNYLRRPVKPVYAFTKVGRAVTYNAGASTQIEWTETSINKIFIKTAQLFGVNLSDELIIQYTELKNKEDI